MYKNIRLCALLIIVALASACQKDLTLGGAEKFVQGETQTFTFNQEGETKMVDMAALGDEWQVENGTYSDWLSAKKVGNMLELIASANEGADERKAQVVVITPNGKQVLDITQFGSEPYITVEGSIFRHYIAIVTTCLI